MTNDPQHDDKAGQPPDNESGDKTSKQQLRDAIVRGQSASAAVRRHAAIQKGLTGDKVPGFDPSAAPMETDAEAGGATTLAYPAPMPDLDDIPPQTDANSSNHGSAMRPFESEAREGAYRLKFVLFAVAAIVLLLVIAAFMLVGL